MRLPPALAPLRHTTFRTLWSANVVVALGTWLQNTGAGWLMTTLSPDALTVSLVQAATIFPVFLLALPAGALADIVDRRLFLITSQLFMLVAAALLAILTLAGQTGVWGLLGLTFAIGIGSAMNQPAWGATMAEVVPREDLVQAVALNGIGYNIARAIGPALAGVILLVAGPGATFSLFALSFLAVLVALLTWRSGRRRSPLPREHFLSAMRAGVRFVRHTPAMRAAIVRSVAFFFPAAAPWAMLPLVVREQLHREAGSFGLLLGLMGVGGILSGFYLPTMRAHASRGMIVLAASVSSFAGMALLASTHLLFPAAFGMVLFGLGWVAAASTAQAAAQLVCPPWVRARALSIYQLAFNGALTAGSFFWGWLGTRIGLPQTMVAAAITGLAMAVAARGFGIDSTAAVGKPAAPLPTPEAADPELAVILPHSRGRVLETMRYHVDPTDRDAFLTTMDDVRQVRGRSGARDWTLYEDVAHPNNWMEQWSVESWTDHLREAMRMSDDDVATLARAQQFRHATDGAPCRYLAVEPSHRARRGSERNVG